MNKKCLPKGICKPRRMILGVYKSYEDSSSNLVPMFGKTIELQDLSVQIQTQEMFIQTGY